MKAEVVRKDQFINRQGRDFALFAGLLDAAHRSGLVSITTKLLQAPNADNDHTAISFAEAQFVGEDGGRYTFTGIGDASAINVGRMIAPHIIRMSETRAVARALRLALNVGVTALEELAEGDDGDGPATRQQQQNHVQQQRPPVADVPDSCQPATKEQLARLAKLQAALGQPLDAPESLSFQEAAHRITTLVKQFNDQAKGGKR